MKKLIIKSVIMVVIMIGISNYALYIMTGKSPFQNQKMPNLSFKAPTKEDLKRTMSGGKETVYKWTDKYGKVHYSSEPPPETQVAKKMEVDPDVNLIKGVEIKDRETASNSPNMPQVTDPLANGVYNPEAIQKLVNDAKNVQNLLNERNEALQKVVGEK